MAHVHIVTDSTADIPAALASELGIAIVPCQVYLGHEAYQDGVDLSPQAFFERLVRSSELPRTSQPPVSHFVATYHRLLNGDRGDAIVSIHVAAGLSGTLNAAWAAAQTLSDPARVEVIDSGQLSMGVGWAVIQAARMAQAGATAAEISRTVHALLPRLRTVAMLDTLENLYKGGRISQVSATLGTVLQIKPILGIQDGHVLVWGRVRTRARALTRLVAMVHDWQPLAAMAIMYTGTVELAQDLAATLMGIIPSNQMVVAPAGPAITTHLGLGALGVCALRADE
jgi:DegV family protein with EDD domain